MTMNEKRDAGEYVRQVQESTQKYARELLHENERLVAVVASLHDEKVRLESRARALEERLRAHDELQSTLLEQLADMEATSRTFTERYLQVEKLNANLANLYVASYRIHGSLERAEVLDTLREILINLIGSEEFAIYERDGAGATMRAATSVGVDERRLGAVKIGEPGIGACIARGVPYVPEYDADATSCAPSITACVPLRVGDRIVGAIVVYKLLAHKASLLESDVELFNLLATHAATALYCAELHARAATEAA
jgi:hypothetical protein